MADEQLLQAAFAFKFDAGKSIRYHSHRRAFWNRLDRWNKIVSTVSGAAVVVAVVAKNSYWEVISGIVVAAMGVADLVLDFSEKSRVHDALYRRWNLLLQEAEEVDEAMISPETIRKQKVGRLEIERDEPDVIRLLERNCSAEECDARGLPKAPVWILNPLQKAICRLLG